MSAYLIANVNVTDSEKMKEYFCATPEILKKYSGRFLVRGGDFTVAEGSWNPNRLVIVEFDSIELAEAFWNSEEYEPLKMLRQANSKTDLILVDGIKE